MPLAETRGEIAVYIPPLDNENIWEGRLTMIEQIHRQRPNGEWSGAIICTISGGGLPAGIVQVMARVVWGSEVQILPVETKEVDLLYQLSQVREPHHHTWHHFDRNIPRSSPGIQTSGRALITQQRAPNVPSLALEDTGAAV
ncbi:uncharacterized protein A1O5_11839 [Cladophialophora psammophila CBS 110553]|uniref:L-serine ammonia-lyase n=1 Tax=Cladophialophora psammophila CBS 110553 TaxID=1182543 RepID=W9VZL6_9EURO|nr:uncharacterized protein A1O5_11839 [Cladophialophora psammophila CBS 110553]EXJ61282.1 hypothetical protein A1O5_11839 [Cladophialophora psammophila CBS 110553]